ncbi:MAG: hypothetical protein K6A05_07135 [Lachnospiraceae bacterium]|nr:hypothetical protein [Lachnospiraceae bacterium]
MEDFSFNVSPEPKTEELSLSVSSICERDGEKIAYVSFTDGKRSAEGEIPACVITKHSGFTDEEVLDLQQYMLSNLVELKKMASKINVLDAFMGRAPRD